MLDRAPTLDPTRPFRRRDALAAGITRSELAGPRFRRGLPEPVVNHKLVTEHGRVRYRFDLSWPDVQVAVEYDGRQHRDDIDQWDHDLERDEWLTEAGWTRVCRRPAPHVGGVAPVLPGEEVRERARVPGTVPAPTGGSPARSSQETGPAL